jgi:hypothetical protein
MENIEELKRQAGEASLNWVAANTVGIVNTLRTSGYDEATNRRGDGEEIGTGCPGRWGTHHFILTAGHVIKAEAQPTDMRIFWRSKSHIERRSDADLRAEDIADGIPVSDPNARIHRCKWEDLAVIVMDPKFAGENTEFFDIANEWNDPAVGEFVTCHGFPIDRRVLVEERYIGNRRERTIAVRPEIFSGRVLPQPSERELRFQITEYNPDLHYLVPYEHPDSKHPHGFSGAAAWWESDEKQLVWRPNFKFAGVCTCCYKKGSVEQIVKASAARRFLEEVFGAA